MGKNKHKRPHGDRGPLAGQVAVKQSKIDKASSCATIELPSLLNPAHAATAAISEYKATFASAAPFPHLRLRDFFKDPSFLEALKTELLALDFAEKSNDLYQFRQSDDLKNVRTPVISKLRQELYCREFRDWLTAVTGIATNDTIDMSCSIYSDTSYLLCHDDDLSERRIAYIMYFVDEEWSPEDGGTLDLYDHDADGRPTAVTKRLTPCWNSFGMFAVSSISHHQVAEVLSASKGARLSIVGWFHGEPVERHPFPLYERPRLLPISVEPPPHIARLAPEDDPLYFSSLSTWIAPQYFIPSAVAQMKSHFAKHASIELRGFLQSKQYMQLENAMKSQPWKFVGPPNVRHYKVAPDYEYESHGILPDTVAILKSLLCSEAFTEYLADVTGMTFTAVTCEVRAFAHGDYSMLCDPQYKQSLRESKSKRVLGKAGLSAADGDDDNDGDVTAASRQSWLDVTMCVIEEEDWEESVGGHVSYLTYDEPLLTVTPAKNSLSIVYRAGNVMSFVKYVNHTAPGTRFDIALQFQVSPDGADSESD